MSRSVDVVLFVSLISALGGCKEKPKPVQLPVQGPDEPTDGKPSDGQDPGQPGASSKGGYGKIPTVRLTWDQPPRDYSQCAPFDPGKVYYGWKDKYGRFFGVFDTTSVEPLCIFSPSGAVGNRVSVDSPREVLIQPSTGKLVVAASGKPFNLGGHSPTMTWNGNAWIAEPAVDQVLEFDCPEGREPFIRPDTGAVARKCGFGGGLSGEERIESADGFVSLSQGPLRQIRAIGTGDTLMVDQYKAVKNDSGGTDIFYDYTVLVTTDGTVSRIQGACGQPRTIRTDPSGLFLMAAAGCVQKVAADGAATTLYMFQTNGSQAFALDGEGTIYSSNGTRCNADGCSRALPQYPPPLLRDRNKVYVTAGDPGAVMALITGP